MILQKFLSMDHYDHTLLLNEGPLGLDIIATLILGPRGKKNQRDT